MAINIDADPRNADWAKRTFDFPNVKTAAQYMHEFGLESPLDVKRHIEEKKDTPFWQGVPARIKNGLMVRAGLADVPST